MGIEILHTDKFFYDSPDAGDPDCLCSRCGKQIPEEDAPMLRAWPSDSDDYGYDPNAKGGTEFRYCRICCEGMGMKFCDPIPDDLPDEAKFVYEKPIKPPQWWFDNNTDGSGNCFSDADLGL